MIAARRKEMKISQRELADRLLLAGMDVDKNSIQQMEAGKRFITFQGAAGLHYGAFSVRSLLF